MARRDYRDTVKTAVLASKRPEITQTEVFITSPIVNDIIKTICDVIRVTMLNLEPVREREGVQNKPQSLIFSYFQNFWHINWPEIIQTEVSITSTIVYNIIKTIFDVIKVTMLNLVPVREREEVQNQSQSHNFRYFQDFWHINWHEITQTKVSITSTIVYDLIKTIFDVIRVIMLNLTPVKEHEGVQDYKTSCNFSFSGILAYQLNWNHPNWSFYHIYDSLWHN